MVAIMSRKVSATPAMPAMIQNCASVTNRLPGL